MGFYCELSFVANIIVTVFDSDSMMYSDQDLQSHVFLGVD